MNHRRGGVTTVMNRHQEGVMIVMNHHRGGVTTAMNHHQEDVMIVMNLSLDVR